MANAALTVWQQQHPAITADLQHPQHRWQQGLGQPGKEQHIETTAAATAADGADLENWVNRYSRVATMSAGGKQLISTAFNRENLRAVLEEQSVKGHTFEGGRSKFLVFTCLVTESISRTNRS